MPDVNFDESDFDPDPDEEGGYVCPECGCTEDEEHDPGCSEDDDGPYEDD